LSLLSEALNFDFATNGMDEAITDDELAGIQGLQTIRDRVVQLSNSPNPTVRDFITHSQRGLPRDPILGDPKEVSYTLEEWFVKRACDSFVFAASHVPGSYEDIVNYIVPERQRRGLYHKDYAGTTLRENVGVPVPPVRDWSGAA
jgi:alkanesulfonate monooxygenase SsuD/methylene tetrahydromethanopterin reductase-like flavin-dependent oxidoreductase (luciferase family)